MLHTEGLAVGYGGKAVLRDVGIRVQPGEILTLIGPNGAGKSTVLKSISRQLAPLAGTVWLDGRPLASMRDDEAARELSVVMTDRIGTEWMTCWDVVSAGRYPYTGRLGILTAADRAKVSEAMELVQAGDLRDREFTRISDGQRQRVLLARAICQEPKVLVMDEPTSFLDIRHKLGLLSVLKGLVRERGLAVVLSLHELDLAQKISDTVLCIREGAVDRWGPPEEIFRGGYIEELYGVREGSYDALSGSLELGRPEGDPALFIVGGGGTGIPLYRRAQRLGIPFAAGPLCGNDLDVPVARALASELILERAFEPIGEETVGRALDVLGRCGGLICCRERFGTADAAAVRLVDRARETGKLLDAGDLASWAERRSADRGA